MAHLSPAVSVGDRSEIAPRICVIAASWFEAHARDLPWRSADRTPWGVLVSEVMLQQTPVARVLPAWMAWLSRWPTPAAVAAAPPSEVIRMWGRLGYPRRSQRLQAAAQVIVDRHDGEVPSDLDDLLVLPGIGTYSARAIAAFAFGQRQPVVDVNVARVIARVVDGESQPPQQVRRLDLERLDRALPSDSPAAVLACAGLMELGALVCTSRAPGCDSCPLRHDCRWRRMGQPGEAAPSGRSQTWAGTDRQVRGRIMASLRESAAPLPPAAIDLLWTDAGQLQRCVGSLLADGLAQRLPDGSITLPD